MRVSLIRVVIAVLAIAGWVSTSQHSFGQLGAASGASTGQSTSGGLSMGNPLDGSGVGTGAGMGGAAMADFDTLINLIQQTIDPDSWLAAGGTSNILPYPSGVYVDPAGHMRRVRETENLRADLLSQPAGPSHQWRQASNLRTVSLRQLDQALQEANLKGLAPSMEILKLAGLSKVQYVRIDHANEDVLLAGPAGDQALGFELQDLAVVAALINSETTPLGCSIEPTENGIRAAQALIQEAGAGKRLARNPRQFTDKMQQEIGPHKVIVFGMAPNTGTAVALVDADEHMKKVGFGKVATRTKINSYFDHLDLQGKVPDKSMIRWWFAYDDAPIRVGASGDIFQLPEQCVAVLSEQQWVTQQGRRPTGGNDAAADAFAEGITENIGALRRSHPSYSRLSAVFEFGLALQIAVETTGQQDLRAWFPTLCALGTPARESTNRNPRTVDGLTAWHTTKAGTVVAVVSGGVKMDPRRLAEKSNWESSRFLASSAVPAPPERRSLAHGRWWWDQALTP